MKRYWHGDRLYTNRTRSYKTRRLVSQYLGPRVSGRAAGQRGYLGNGAIHEQVESTWHASYPNNLPALPA